MKKYIVIVLCLLIGTTACTAEQIPPAIPTSSVEHFSSVELNTVDELVEYSTNIVKATLASVEEFDGGMYVYLFDVTEDFSENTPQQVHVYHGFDERYTVGHSYYLFLVGTDVATYPHTIYTTAASDLGFDAEGVQALSSEDIGQVNQAEDVISQAVQEDTVGVAVEGQLPEVSFAEDISEVAKGADVIARVRLSQREITKSSC